MKKFLCLSLCCFHSVVLSMEQSVQSGQLNPEGPIYYHNLESQAQQFSSEVVPLRVQVNNIQGDENVVPSHQRELSRENAFVVGQQPGCFHKMLAASCVCAALTMSGIFFVVMPLINIIKG